MIAKKEYKQAAKLFKQAHIKSPSSVLALGLHRLLLHLKQNEAAAKILVDWLEKQPQDHKVRLFLAMFYQTTKKTEQAILEYEAIIKQQPKAIAALNNLAWLYFEKKDSRCVAIAEQIHQLEPANPEIVDTVGWIMLNHGQQAQGLELLQQAAKGKPENLSIRYHFAVGLKKNNRQKEAKEELKKILAKNKPFPEKDKAEKLLGNL